MPSTYLLVLFLKSHALTASQPLHRTHQTGRDISTSHHFLSLSCSRLPQDDSTESNSIPLPKLSSDPFYLHAKWITNQQPPDDTLFEADRQYFSLSPYTSSCIFYLASFESTVSSKHQVIWLDSTRIVNTSHHSFILFTVFLLSVPRIDCL